MVNEKIKLSVWLFVAFLLFNACNPGEKPRNRTWEKFNMNQQLPKALVVTTGFEGENATLPKGIVIALQAFNREGVTVTLKTRDILYQPDKLNDYNILILSTAPGYHDADRKYSLSYMSENEMKIIRSFVKNGGVLISGDNVGRNMMDGTDRITLDRSLDHSNYPLADIFGVKLTEHNMEGFRIYGGLSGNNPDYIRQVAEKNFYTLVPDSIYSKKIAIMAQWVNDKDTLPAVLKNRSGKGTAYLLASSDLLHPANEGGFLSTKRICEFYKEVVQDFKQKNDISLKLMPWPNAHDFAFAVTLNASGKLKEYERTLKLLEKADIVPDIFVSGNVPGTIKKLLIKQKLPIHSRGFKFTNYRQLNYGQATRDILENEMYWDTHFDGFRFPYTMTDFWGLMALVDNQYAFESSIGANNLEFIHGSIVPHNLVLASSGYYKSTDLMEVAPTYHDDYYFLKSVDNAIIDNKRVIIKKTNIYRKYLQNYLTYAVKPYNGAFVYQGHPAYVGHNDTTITALDTLIKHAKKENSWITTIGTIADFRYNLMKLKFYVQKKNKRTIIHVGGPENIRTDNVTIAVDRKPDKVKAVKGNVKTKSMGNSWFIIFDAYPGQKLKIFY
ncbi:MAG: hypothetical protein K9H84_02645 [Bacteroidales bacterium]|nr:hypothetical protein [Bacteroidales bacterium]